MDTPTFQLPELPYPQDALAPHISERTMQFHYGKHHAAYVANLNRMLGEAAAEGGAVGGGGGMQSLEDIITSASPGGLFNNAAQVWNHTFYWKSMSPGAPVEPDGSLAAAINASFGSLDALKAELLKSAVGNFGSGWTWLVRRGAGAGAGDGDGAELAVVNTDDAGNPLVDGLEPLLTIDVWEHAYYLDYQNARPAYVETFLNHLINWEFAANNYAG